MIRVFTERCFRTDINFIFSSFLIFYQNKLQGRVVVVLVFFAGSVKLLFREVFFSLWFLVVEISISDLLKVSKNDIKGTF